MIRSPASPVLRTFQLTTLLSGPILTIAQDRITFASQEGGLAPAVRVTRLRVNLVAPHSTDEPRPASPVSHMWKAPEAVSIRRDRFPDVDSRSFVLQSIAVCFS